MFFINIYYIRYWYCFFIFGIIISIFELAFIYASSPKKLELTIIDNIPTAIIYTNYFFLPFTTKIRKYKNIKKAYIKNRIERGKNSSYTVYDLFLKFDKKSIVLFKGKRTEEDLLKDCEKINQSINSFENCFSSSDLLHTIYSLFPFSANQLSCFPKKKGITKEILTTWRILIWNTINRQT